MASIKSYTRVYAGGRLGKVWKVFWREGGRQRSKTHYRCHRGPGLRPRTSEFRFEPGPEFTFILSLVGARCTFANESDRVLSTGHAGQVGQAPAA